MAQPLNKTPEALAEIEAAIRAACDLGAWEPAVTVALRGYGPELLGYLNALLRDPAEADDVFATVCEQIWTALPRFGWQSTFRTWAYAIARNAVASFMRGQRRRRTNPLSTAALGALAAEVRTTTASFMNAAAKDRLAAVREALDPDDQTLLILRVDRDLPWRDVAQVFEGEGATGKALDQRAAALRKRFERLKDDLRELLGRK